MFATVTNVEHPQARGMVSKVVCVSIMMALVVLASAIINWTTGVMGVTGPSIYRPSQLGEYASTRRGSVRGNAEPFGRCGFTGEGGGGSSTRTDAGCLYMRGMRPPHPLHPTKKRHTHTLVPRPSFFDRARVEWRRSTEAIT